MKLKQRLHLTFVLSPPSTATVIGIQSDGESLLEERRGGDSQKGSSGKTDHVTLPHYTPLFCLVMPSASLNIHRDLVLNH